jgi:hypothetical protein
VASGGDGIRNVLTVNHERAGRAEADHAPGICRTGAARWPRRERRRGRGAASAGACRPDGWPRGPRGRSARTGRRRRRSRGRSPPPPRTNCTAPSSAKLAASQEGGVERGGGEELARTWAGLGIECQFATEGA